MTIKRIAYILLLALPTGAFAQYTGSGAVTQGLATATTGNLYTCANGRVARLGSITASNNTVWTVPAVVNFTNNTFPFASNLYNPCTGANYANAAAALAALDGTDIVNIDANSELITAFIFSDNYFEMYVNGVAVGKDNVPYTQFNSNIVRFRVNKPFTVAMLLVDWEENLGVGSENNNGFAYYPGDGGMVAVFKDSDNHVIATTGSNWKAQTFYTAPVTDLSCPTETGALRLSNNCSTQNSNNGTSYYGLHWVRPNNWMDTSFNDTNWPNATEFSNAAIGVDNKPAYTNFTDIFDDPVNDAAFIWSTNLILDNEVVVRYTVQPTTSIFENKAPNKESRVFPNPFNSQICINKKTGYEYFKLMDAVGHIIYSGNNIEAMDFSNLPAGIYYLCITDRSMNVYKIVK